MKMPLNVLIVEDNPTDARMLVAELRAAGFESLWTRVEIEPDFLAEVEKLPDIILSDYSMPQFSGLRAVELLRASGLDIPFILISGTVGEDVAVEAMQHGATDYLLKDNLVRLGSAVERALREKEVRAEGRKAALALQESEAEFRLLTEAMPQIVWVTRPDGWNIYFNRHWVDYTGLTPEEGAGHGWMNAFHPGDQPRALEAWQKAVAEITTYSIEARLRSADGTYRWWLVRGVPQPDIHGNILKWIGTFTDIHNLKVAEESLRLLNTAVRQSGESILITDAELESPGPHIVFVNPAFTRMTGYTAEEVAGKTPRLLQGPRTDREMLDRLRKNLKNGDSFEGEAIQYRKDGTEYTQQWRITPIRESGESITHFLAIQRDITERKRTEMALKESELRYHSLFENMLEGYTYCRAVFERGQLTDLIYLEVNGAFEKLTGLNDVTGKKISTIIPGVRKSNRELFELYERVLLTGRPERCETCIKPLDIWLSIAVYSFEREHFVTVFDNITARKRSEELLVTSKQRLSLATESAHIGIWDWDVVANKMVWDAQMFALYGIREEDFSNEVDSWHKSLHPEDLARSEAEIAAAFKGTKDFNTEFRIVWPNGDVRHIEAHAVVQRAESGAAVRMIGVNWDITERKKLEAQFLRAQRMESIGTLAGGIAHDLNNALAPILMALEILGYHITDDAGRELLATVEASAEHGAKLVQQVLSFARGVDGQRIIVNPVHTWNEIQTIVRDTFPKDIDFTFSPSRELWTVTGDPTQLHQVFTNLCVNARDAMPQGGSLRVTMENIVLDEVYTGMSPDAKPGPYVLVKVTDTGTGMPAEIRDKIFEPFFTTKETGKGTGLGLSTALAIIKSHGGFINLYSEVGKGTTFKVYLPANTTRESPKDAAIQEPELPRGNGEWVLLVDDEELILRIAKKTLEQFGYQVMPASNGAEAIAIYAQYRERIDVVLTDMAMPVMDGPATIIALEAMNPKVKIIGSSGLTSRGGVAKALGAGVRHFVQKPYSAKSLLKIVAEALRADA